MYNKFERFKPSSIIVITRIRVHGCQGCVYGFVSFLFVYCVRWNAAKRIVPLLDLDFSFWYVCKHSAVYILCTTFPFGMCYTHSFICVFIASCTMLTILDQHCAECEKNIRNFFVPLKCMQNDPCATLKRQGTNCTNIFMWRQCLISFK